MLGPRFDVQGLAAIWASEELKGIVSKINLLIDDKYLQDQNLTKEAVLAQVKNVITTAERSLDFAKLDSSQPIMQKNVEQAKVNFLIRAALFKNLAKEAMEHFQKIQHNKELHAALRAYISRISEANYQKMIAESEAQLLAEQQRELLDQMILAELDRMNREAQWQWDEHQRHIEHLDNKIHDLRQQRQQVWDKYEGQITQAVANFKSSTGSQPFADLSQEQQKQLGRDYAIEGEKLEQKIAQLKHGVVKREHRINEIDKEEKSLIEQMRAQEGPKIVAMQERNKKDGILVPQRSLENQLKSKIDASEIIQALRKEKSELQADIQTKKEKIPEYEKELNNLLRTYLGKHYSPQQVDAMFKENPNLENEFKKHMESNADYMNYKMEIGKVNKEVFDLKGVKEIELKSQAILEKSNQKNNEDIQRQCEVATPPLNKLAERLKQRKAAAMK
ncbi:MAG: hypothetical protein JSR17_13500 [Proteobacteria bacterium]|nr:hypothetical protein [Pseudomonadota bacterium]